MLLRIGYDRRKNPETREFRPATEEDVRGFYRGQRVWALANDGSARQVTIKSALKTWQKTSPTRNYTMQLSISYGLYEHDQWRNCGCGDDDFSRFLIEVSA